MRKRSWTVDQLKEGVAKSHSVRQLLGYLGLKEAGGNYSQVKKYLQEYKVETPHFKGRGWNKGLTGFGIPRIKLEDILVVGSTFQSYKLKNRLLAVKLKEPRCEECGWAMVSDDGRLPLEIDHINGDSRDNRIENLRILCPNCHSLKPTHRGRNRRIACK